MSNRHAQRPHHPPRYEVGVHAMVGGLIVAAWSRCTA